MKTQDLACPKPHISASKIDDFLMFFRDPLLDLSFQLRRLGAKMLDFGTPLAPSWVQHVAQNLPSGIQNRPFLGRRSAKSTFLEPAGFQDLPEALLSIILDGFGMNFDGFGP